MSILRAASLALIALAGCGGSERADNARPKSLDDAFKAFAARLPERADDATPLSANELAELARPDRTVAGLTIDRPIGTSVTDRPVLGWLAVTGADRYRVRLVALDAASSSRPIVDESTTASSLPFPARAEALTVGRQYVLEVTSEGGSPASGRSRFDVLPVPHRSRWKTISGDLESNERDPVRELLLAHAALRRGLFDEAERRLSTLLAARPHDPDAATLRRAMDSLLGR